MCEFNIKRVKFHNLSNKKKIYYNAIIQCRYQFIKLGRKDMNILLIRKVTRCIQHLCIIIIMIVSQAGLLLLEYLHGRLEIHLDSFLTSFEPVKQSKEDAQINSSPLETYSIHTELYGNIKKVEQFY